MAFFKLFKETFLGINREKREADYEKILEQDLPLSEDEQVRILQDSRELLEEFGFDVEKEIRQLREEGKKE
jgi:hypothetical protein